MKQTNTTPTLKMDKLRTRAAARSPPAAVFFVFREVDPHERAKHRIHPLAQLRQGQPRLSRSDPAFRLATRQNCHRRRVGD